MSVAALLPQRRTRSRQTVASPRSCVTPRPPPSRYTARRAGPPPSANSYAESPSDNSTTPPKPTCQPEHKVVVTLYLLLLASIKHKEEHVGKGQF